LWPRRFFIAFTSLIRMATPLTGGCLCGGVRYEVDPDSFVSASYCHCTRCQRRTGTAASPNVRVRPEGLTVTAGQELIREWAPPDGNPKLFCGECGSALFSRPPDDPRPVGIRFGSFDSDPGIRPQWRQHVATAAVWEPLPDDGLPRHDRSAS
jgi:hypothetical protein